MLGCDRFLVQKPKVRLKYIGSGRHRDVYLLSSGKYVVKVPNGEWGHYDNEREAKLCRIDGLLKIIKLAAG